LPSKPVTNSQLNSSIATESTEWVLDDLALLL